MAEDLTTTRARPLYRSRGGSCHQPTAGCVIGPYLQPEFAASKYLE
jgi:hypothetical protein